MEQVQNQWIVVKEEEEEEEEQDATALEGRQSLQHRKDGLIFTGAMPPCFSSSSPTSEGICSASVEEPLILKQKEEEEEEEPRTLKEEEHLIQEEKEDPTQKKEEVEEIGTVVENGNHLSDEHPAVGLGLEDEFVGDVTDGEAIQPCTTTINVAAFQNKSSVVYFDKQQASEVSGLKGVQKGDGARSVLPKSHGEGEFEIQVENLDGQNSLCNEVNQHVKVSSSSELSPLHNSSKVQATTAEHFGDGSGAKAFPNLMKEIDQQLEELDVEAVLAKQETHDLFCPNCKSCITKRVILKKRKRNIRNLNTETKPDKSDSKRVHSSPHEAKQGGHAVATSDVGSHEAKQGGHAIATSDVGSQEPPADNYEPEREPEVFRCLSCFSFFIPLRNGFKLFPNFGGAHEPEASQNPLIIPAYNMENPSNVAAPNANWFRSLFTKKGKKASEQGEASVENSRAGPAEQRHSSSITANMITSSGNGSPEGSLADTAISKNVKLAPDTKPEHGGVNSPMPSPVKSVMIEPGIENGIKSSMASGNESLADQKSLNSSLKNDLSSIQSCTPSSSNVINGLQKVRVDFVDFSVKEHLLPENAQTDVGEEKNDSVDMIKTDTVADMPSMGSSDDMVSMNESVIETAATTELDFSAEKPAEDTIMKCYEGSLILKNSQKDVNMAPKIVQNSNSSLMQEAHSPAQSFGSAVVANDEEAFKSSTPQIVDNLPVQRAIVTGTHTEIYIEEQPRAEMGEPPKWEILKSVVYGGLIESITSLGIVSSAAGSGAGPLNIIALGLANLIGGLFIIIHNVIELKNDHSGGDLQQMNMQEDRYQEQLGRRENFLLHAVVAVLSFLIFGSVPMVVYGLLIHKNYYAEVKLAAVAVTSIVCIILLAIGKVYTTRPPRSYIKTVLLYVTLAFASSGVSYIVGELVNHLLENFNGSKSGFVLTMPSSGTTSDKTAWMSY